MRWLFVAGVVTGAACLCAPEGRCVSADECDGRACIEGQCAPTSSRDAGVTVVVGGGPGGGAGAGAAGGPGGGAVVPACASQHTGSLTGVVTEPSGRLGLPGVLVYVPSVGLEALPRGPSARCSGCDDDVSGQPLTSALTTATGTFRLDDVPAGPRTRLVVQTGRWRREVEAPVVECRTTAVAPALTRLPRSRAEGDLPQMALVTGGADPLECLLLRLGLEPSEFTRPDAGGAVHLYFGNGQTMDGGLPPATELLASSDRLLGYDAVFAPCRGTTIQDASNRTRPALQHYLDSGGRFFTTHYGYDWMMTAPLDTTANWSPTAQYADLDTVDVVTSFPKGATYREWLTRVAGVGSQVRLVDPRYNVGRVTGSSIAWLFSRGRRPDADPDWTAQLTFTTPLDAGVGCGRVAFSDFHVSTNVLLTTALCQQLPCPPPPVFPDNCLPVPLSDQEKVLTYILFDLGTCARNDREAPEACGALDAGCSRARPCCGDLRCVDPVGALCDGGACTCGP